jgi:type I restriction enzyme S subunit
MKYRLGDICTITKGATGIMKAIPGPYTMITLGETDKSHIDYQFDAKAVIIPLVSSTGHGHASMKRVKYYEGKFALGNILSAVIPKDENFVLAKYLHIFLHWNRDELLVSQMKGMANVSLPMNRIEDVMITVPDIEKQREIVEIESKLAALEQDAEIRYQHQLSLLSTLNQAILQEAVQGKLVKQNPAEEPAGELLKRIKEEKAALQKTQGKGKSEKPLPPVKPEEIPFEIPGSWVWCRLGEIVTLISGQDLLISEFSESNTGGIPYLTGASNLEEGLVILNRWTKNPRSISILGDLLLTCKGSGVGKNAILTLTEVHIARQLMAIRPMFIEIKYIQFVINLEISVFRGKAKSQIPGIDRSIVLNTMIPLPPLSEQRRIVAEIERQMAKTRALKEHIEASREATGQLLKALLHEAFEVGVDGGCKKNNR